MALNMDDLIGSMQHGFHAGDRGDDLNQIRESLKLSLGPQHPSQQQSNQPIAGPSNYASHNQNNYQFSRRQQQQATSSLDADVAMLSSSSNQNNYYSHPLAPGGQFFGSGGGPGSWGSQSSASSSNFGAPAGGWGFAPAPANTPQQTPVEASALARQLQAELEQRQAAASTSPPQYTSQTQGGQAPLSPTLSAGSAGHNQNYPGSPPSLYALQQQAQQPGGDSPRSYVNGFTPPADGSSSPNGAGMAANTRSQQRRQAGTGLMGGQR